MAIHTSKSIIKFADDTTVVGLITNNDETAYREEVRVLVEWCQENNLSQRQQNEGADHGLQETAEGASPFPHRRDHNGEGESFKFLGVQITDCLKWSTHTASEVKNPQHRLYNLRRLKKSLNPDTLLQKHN